MAGGLTAAHSGAAVPFVRDGVMMLHKEGRYMAGASSPLALLWKDAACSRYLLDTDPSGVVPPLQVTSNSQALPLPIPAKSVTVRVG